MTSATCRAQVRLGAHPPAPPTVRLPRGRHGGARRCHLPDATRVHQRVPEALSEPLLERPEDERPIIILQADEGPYPRRFGWHAAGFDAATATDDELITKFGILSAWLLPGPEGAAPLDPAMTAINTYRELFQRYFGSDVADAPDRVFMSLKDRPYDLVDITDRLAAAEQRLVTKAAAPADAAAVPDVSPTVANGDASAAETSSA